MPPELLAYCPADARIVDTAPMTLDEIEAEFVAAHAAGLDVARLHSGDLSVYSALAEQLRRLERRGIPYTLTPGVPAFAAAAAALGCELTVPEVAQSVVLTRMPGRASAHAGGRAARRLRRDRRDARDPSRDPRRSIAIVEELTPFYGADCPVAVVVRASWPDERIVRGTLGDIAGKVAAEPIERTALVLVGPALAAEDFRDSALYDPDYRRRFRGGALVSGRERRMADQPAVAVEQHDLDCDAPALDHAACAVCLRGARDHVAERDAFVRRRARRLPPPCSTAAMRSLSAAEPPAVRGESARAWRDRPNRASNADRAALARAWSSCRRRPRW